MTSSISDHPMENVTRSRKGVKENQELGKEKLGDQRNRQLLNATPQQCDHLCS